MLRLIEHTLIGAFNRALDRRKAATATAVVSDDLMAIGHTLPLLSGVGPSSQASAPLLQNQPFRSEPVALSVEARRRHVYVLGATGTGKTNLLLRLIESDIAASRSLCVVDLRGDLIDRVLLRLAAARPPEYWADHLLMLDLRDNHYAVGFNPLAGAGDVYNRALHVLAVVKAQSESWGVQLEETLRNSLLALASSGWTLLEIEPLLTNRAFRSQIVAQVEDSRVRTFFERYDKLSPAQQTTWALAVLNKVNPLISLPTLRRVFGQRQALPLRLLLDEVPGQVILVSLAVDRLHEAARLAGGLFVSSFQNAIMARADQPELSRLPVNLYVDEFETMASDRFESIVAEGRRFGLGLTLSHQNNNQLDTDLRHVLRNNVHTQFYFQTGALDASELAREIGGSETRETVRSTLIGQGVGQTFLIRRGQPTVRVQVLPCPDPRIKREQVEVSKSAAHERYARPVADIDHELREREVPWNATPLARPNPGKSQSGAEGTTTPPETPTDEAPATASYPTYEIRHEKLGHFSSHFSQDADEEDSP